MPIKPYFFGHVKDDLLVLKSPDQWNGYIRTFNGKDVRLTIERKPNRLTEKTREQLGYYFAVCVPVISEAINGHTGYLPDKEQTHHWLVEKLFYKLVIMRRPDGREIAVKVPRRLRDATVDETSKLIEDVKLFAASELGIYIPEPSAVEVT